MGQETSDETSPSSVLTRADSPFVRRFRGVINELTGFVRDNHKDDRLGRMAFVLSAIGDELSEELQDSDPDTMAAYWSMIGNVMEWIGTGDTEALPDFLQAFARKISGEPEPEEVKELTA